MAAGADCAELPVRWVDGGSNGLAGGQNAAFRHTTDAGGRRARRRLRGRSRLDRGAGARVRRRPGAGAGRRPRPAAPGVGRQDLRGGLAQEHRGGASSTAARPPGKSAAATTSRCAGNGSIASAAATSAWGPARLVGADSIWTCSTACCEAGGRALYEPGAVVLHEPATRRGRLERRVPYGYGMGAACGFRLREGDLRAARMLAGWLLLRLRVLASALLAGRWAALREEALVVGGTAGGRGARHQAGRCRRR